jgi:hypothetical protein
LCLPAPYLAAAEPPPVSALASRRPRLAVACAGRATAAHKLAAGRP